MNIYTSSQPAKDLGAKISEEITRHQGEIVCLLSGGSALDVFEYIQVPVELRTIFMMGDERWSGETSINNYLQLQNHYPNQPLLDHILPSVPQEQETLTAFAHRIEKTFLEELATCDNPKIIMLLGMGTDGHTAGIFPLPQPLFSTIYAEDTTYVPVEVEGLKIASRASFTPRWILNHVDSLYGYVVGLDKQTVLKSLVNEDKPIYERPAELWKSHPNMSLYTDQTIL